MICICNHVLHTNYIFSVATWVIILTVVAIGVVITAIIIVSVIMYR